MATLPIPGLLAEFVVLGLQAVDQGAQLSHFREPKRCQNRKRFSSINVPEIASRHLICSRKRKFSRQETALMHKSAGL